MLAHAVVVFLLVGASCAYEKTYEGFELLQVETGSDYDRNIVNFIRLTDEELDIWYESPEEVHLFIPPEKLDDIKVFLDRKGLSFSVLNNHIQRDIEQEETRLRRARAYSPRAFNYNDFNTFDDIVAELNAVAARCRSDLGVSCSVYSIGKTVQGRDLWTLKISKSGAGRKAVWLDATIHAREWLATATNLRIMQHLVDDYGSDADATRLVDAFDWLIQPVANPDGYVYTWATDRMWRKNRSPNSGSSCIGTDLNRNYNQMWGNAGASTSACSETYRGSSAGSELETQAVQAEAVRVGSTLITSIHLHTYGQYWLIPWGSYAADGRTCNIATDDVEMMVVANAAWTAIQNTYGTSWLRGNSCATIYPASGITMDYFKGVAGVKYTATPELRGGSFVVSNTLIEPSFNEVWNGVVAALDAIPK